MPAGHPSIWLKEAGLGERFLGHSDTESKKVKLWGRGFCLVAWPRGWMLGANLHLPGFSSGGCRLAHPKRAVLIATSLTPSLMQPQVFVLLL